MRIRYLTYVAFAAALSFGAVDATAMPAVAPVGAQIAAPAAPSAQVEEVYYRRGFRGGYYRGGYGYRRFGYRGYYRPYYGYGYYRRPYVGIGVPGFRFGFY